jgi:hypothetical protein
LSLLNQGAEILAGAFGVWLFVKLALNYLTPFVVANFGLLSRSGGERETGDNGALDESGDHPDQGHR